MESFRDARPDHAPCIELLAEPVRWHVLRHLMQASTNHASLDELVNHLGTDTATGSDLGPERVRIRLHHCDLPKLADHGVIDYDPRSGDVRYHPNDRIEALLECLECD